VQVEMRVRWLLWNLSHTPTSGLEAAVAKHKSPPPDLTVVETALSNGLKAFPSSAYLHILTAQYVCDYRHHVLVEKDHLSAAEAGFGTLLLLLSCVLCFTWLALAFSRRH
jgi:hypothetical protein